MKKFLILGLIPLLLMVPGNAFGEKINIESSCENGFLILVFTDDDGNLLIESSVRTLKELGRASGYEEKFVSDESGSVKIPNSKNTGFVWVQKGGFDDLKTIVEKCPEVQKESNSNIIIETNPDFSYLGEFWEYQCDSGVPIGVVVKDVVQDNGYLLFDISLNGNHIGEQFAYITESNPKHLFCVTFGTTTQDYTFTAKNGDTQTSINWNPFNEKVSEDAEEEFRKLPSPEKKYDESMNILGKVIRIFDDKICVEEFCKYDDTLPVYIQGNIGLNTKDPIKLQIVHCNIHWFGFCDDLPGYENIIIGEISAKNNGGGDFYADWTIRKTASEGLFQIRGVVDGKVVGDVADSMMDIINGYSNSGVLVISNIEKLSPSNITFLEKEDATISVSEIEYGQINGIVHYEVCLKRDLKNPSFEILSDIHSANVVQEGEFREGDCYKGSYTMRAKAPTTIKVPLGTEKSASSDEIDSLKEELAELRKMLEDKEDKPKVPGWVKNNVQWWANGQVDDATFINGIEFMVKEKVINIPDLPPQASETAEQKIPDWIRNNAIWWSEGAISEDDFVNGIEFLVQNGIIQVQ